MNFSNFFSSKNKSSKISDFQDLDHLDGVAISVVNAKLYPPRDDLVLFYFRNGANYASVYTQSTIISENIKWNKQVSSKKIKALLINTRNANAFTGKNGFQGLRILQKNCQPNLQLRKKTMTMNLKKLNQMKFYLAVQVRLERLFQLKIMNSLPELMNKITYNQNKYLWVKAALGITTTDLVPKIAMEECRVGNINIKIYGVAKGSGMIYPNMATTLGYIFTDAKISSKILKKL